MDANAEFDAALCRHARIALNHCVLDFNRAPHCIDHTAELNDSSVAGTLYDSPVVHLNSRIEQITPQCSQSCKCPILVCASESTKTDHVSGQNGYQAALHSILLLWRPFSTLNSGLETVQAIE